MYIINNNMANFTDRYQFCITYEQGLAQNAYQQNMFTLYNVKKTKQNKETKFKLVTNLIDISSF